MTKKKDIEAIANCAHDRAEGAHLRLDVAARISREHAEKISGMGQALYALKQSIVARFGIKDHLKNHDINLTNQASKIGNLEAEVAALKLRFDALDRSYGLAKPRVTLDNCTPHFKPSDPERRHGYDNRYAQFGLDEEN